MTNHPVRLGMIGGGLDAFIGSVHRRAATMDGRLHLVAGCLSKDPASAKASGAAYGLDPDRAYVTVEAMLNAETARPQHERVELIAIVTPNFTHHAIARACLERGFHVLVEKPMTVTVDEARDLEALAAARGLVCAVMYNYTGYPMIRQARELIRDNAIGTIRKVFVEYHQGWLSTRAESAGVVQAEWRTDPARAGLGGALGDIGSHAENLVAFVTGLEIESLSAELTSFVAGRRLDDDAAVLIRYRGGAKGVLTASQVCAGEGNAFSLRVYGDKGGLRWRQESPESLEVTSLEGPTRTFVRGGPGSLAPVHAASRIPVGHPEGFIEAFANVYLGAADLVRGIDSPMARATPRATEGRRGVAFIERAVASARAASAWLSYPSEPATGA